MIPVAGKLEALYAVMNETRALFHRLRAAADEVHRRKKITAGMRGVLEGLDRLGPQTVPQMARARPVSRQHIQALVNPLAARGYVELVENPAHQRSRLVQLTQQGKHLVETMRQREARVLGELDVGVSERDLRAAAALLRQLGAVFESHEWKRRVRQARSPETLGRSKR